MVNHSGCSDMVQVCVEKREQLAERTTSGHWRMADETYKKVGESSSQQADRSGLGTEGIKYKGVQASYSTNEYPRPSTEHTILTERPPDTRNHRRSSKFTAFPLRPHRACRLARLCRSLAGKQR